jgi:4-amino-4-deoxy-L-arabinose transferase-like glycosyltransferase
MKTRTLLTCALVAGPLYVGVGTIEILFRPGFDIRRHALSLMSNGDLGWIQIASFIVSGALVVVGAVGIRRAMRGESGATWGPALLGLYGVGLIAAGCFVADPMDGFPIGTPPGPPVVTTWHGPLHFMAGGIGFFGLIAASLVFARHFAIRSRAGWAAFSLATGVLFFAAFASIASGSKQHWIVPAFTAAVVLAWTWVSALAVHLRETT